MKKLIMILILPYYIFALNFLDITLENKINNKFQDYLFVDTNASTTQNLQTDKSHFNLNLEGNFNEMVGFSLDYSHLGSSDKYQRNEIYFGTPYLKFFSFGTVTNDIKHNGIPVTKRAKHYSLLNFIIINTYNFEASQNYSFRSYDSPAATPIETKAFWSYELETRSITTELFYDTVKEDALKKKDYIYPVAISQNFLSRYRIYGVAILSLEQYDYTRGKIHYFDQNGTKSELFLNDGNSPTGFENHYKVNPQDGRFKGIGFGYKLTAEAYFDEFSFFITSFYKRIKLNNFYTKTEGGGYPDNILTNGHIKIQQQYTSFGLRYRF